MKDPRPIAQTPFRFKLDLESGVPVYRQVIDQVQAGIATGSLGPGDIAAHRVQRNC